MYVGCNGYMGGLYAGNDGKPGIGTNDVYILGGRYTAGYTFYDRPFRDFDASMQFELILQMLIITQNGYKSNPNNNYPDACGSDTVEQYGPGADGFRAICDPNFTPYYEVTQCLRDPFSAEFTDCTHDMDLVGGVCYRCPRYYGKNGTQGCFKCYDDCIECTGGQNDQCTYCGQGYGFTGTSCQKCTVDQTWDLSRNLCQKKKVRFMEADYGLATFGKVVLMFEPLNGEADMSLYVENMFDRYWITDINSQYYLIRKYENLPLHRKVSVSFEFMMIDTAEYAYFWVAVDKNYIYSWSPNY